MSEIGGSEVLLLIIIGLIVLGPERLPRVANQIGSWLGQARRMTRMMRRQLEEEVNFDLKKEMGLNDPVTGQQDYKSPTFVQDRHTKPADDDVEDLPDDYSPAHGEDDVGTGVSDDPPSDTQLADTNSDSDAQDSAATPESEPAAANITKTQSA